MGIFGKLIGLALDIVETPIAVIKDAATLGSQLTDEGKPYTERKLKEIREDYEDIKDNLKNS